jgi:DNA-binding XRE family transcriptional regulator
MTYDECYGSQSWAGFRLGVNHMASSAEESMGAFWNDLNQNLHNDEFRYHYALTSLRIAAIDSLVNELDARREACGLSKAELARAVDKSPEAIGQLLTAENPNPTLGTFVELAAVLGLRISVEPMADDERAASCLAPCPPGRLAPS